MAMTREELEQLLTEMDLKFEVRGPAQLALIFRTQGYRHPDGEPYLLLVLELEEEGEYLRLFAPSAFVARGAYVDTFLRACAMVEWETKLIQFEYDDEDGEVRPMIEFPLEDGKVTRLQLERCIRSLCALLETFYVPLQKALDEGKIDLPRGDQRGIPPSPPAFLAELLIAALLAEGREPDDPRLVMLRKMVEELRSKGEAVPQPLPAPPEAL